MTIRGPTVATVKAGLTDGKEKLRDDSDGDRMIRHEGQGIGSNVTKR